MTAGILVLGYLALDYRREPVIRRVSEFIEGTCRFPHK